MLDKDDGDAQLCDLGAPGSAGGISAIQTLALGGGADKVAKVSAFVFILPQADMARDGSI